MLKVRTSFSPQCGCRREVRRLCLFDTRLETVCTVPNETSSVPPNTTDTLLLKAGEETSRNPSESAESTSVWTWAAESREMAVLCTRTSPFFLGALLFKLPEKSPGGHAPGDPEGEGRKGVLGQWLPLLLDCSMSRSCVRSPANPKPEEAKAEAIPGLGARPSFDTVVYSLSHRKMAHQPGTICPKSFFLFMLGYMQVGSSLKAFRERLRAPGLISRVSFDHLDHLPIFRGWRFRVLGFFGLG